MNFEYKGEHHCDAAVIICVDFRFTDAYLAGVKETFGIRTFDMWAVPGAAKNFVDPSNESFAQSLIEKIKQVSVGLHNIKKIIVLDHADCGAYGGRNAFENLDAENSKHSEDLQKTREVLGKHFPDLEIHTGIAALNEEQTEVEVIEFI